MSYDQQLADALRENADLMKYAEQLKRERDDACEGARALNAEANKWKLLVDDALPIVQRYAYENPCWTNGIGPTQDPQGAHAWLAAVAALSKNTTAAPEPPDPEDHEQPKCGWNAAEEGVCYECGFKGSREPGYIPPCPREPQGESDHG